LPKKISKKSLNLGLTTSQANKTLLLLMQARGARRHSHKIHRSAGAGASKLAGPVLNKPSPAKAEVLGRDFCGRDNFIDCGKRGFITWV
jgi:hypothetical protein